MFSVFAKSAAHQNLSPAARAFLKLIEGCVIAGVVAALPVLAMALGQATPDWPGIGRIALGTFATAALMAAVKYCKAQGDPPLAQPVSQVLTAAATAVGKWAGPSDSGNRPAPAPPTPAPVPASTYPLLIQQPDGTVTGSTTTSSTAPLAPPDDPLVASASAAC